MLTGYSHKECIKRGIEDFTIVSFKNVFNYLGTDNVALLCKIDGEPIDNRVPEFRPATSNLDAYLGSMWYGYLSINGRTIRAIETQNANPIYYWISDDDFVFLCSDTTKCRVSGNK